jgi:hypothetical protein
MTYRLKLYEADASPDELKEAERRFRHALESTLGDAALVVPVFRAVQRILGAHGEEPARESLSDEEWLVVEQWRAAEAAAVAAAFGPNRYMGDAMYAIET